MVSGGWLWYTIMCAITMFNIAFCAYVFVTRHWKRQRLFEKNYNNDNNSSSNSSSSGNTYLQQLIPSTINDLATEKITAPLKQQSAMNVCCWIFVLVAGYRSTFPRIDVPRICWFDSPFSYIVYGRISASIAEICWAFQISIVLSNFASGLAAHTTYKMALLIVPLAIVAECFSWTCISIENRLYCTCEESIWTVIFLIAFLGHIYLYKRVGYVNPPTSLGIGYFGYSIFLFLCIIAQLLQVVLYVTRYIEDTQNNVKYKGFIQGFELLHSCKTISKNIDDWGDDAAWMTGYFSICVWSSIWLTIPPRIPNTGSGLL